MAARLLTLNKLADIVRLLLHQVRLLAWRGADPSLVALAFLAQATLDAADGDSTATGDDPRGGTRGRMHSIDLAPAGRRGGDRA